MITMTFLSEDIRLERELSTIMKKKLVHRSMFACQCTETCDVSTPFEASWLRDKNDQNCEGDGINSGKAWGQILDKTWD